MTDPAAALPMQPRRRTMRLMRWLPGLPLLVLLFIYVGSGMNPALPGIYPLRILFNQLTQGNSLLFSLTVIASGIYLLVRVRGIRWPDVARLGLMLVLLTAIVCGTCGYLPQFLIFSPGWRHLDSADLDSHRYQLALYETFSDGTIFYLHECDRFGLVCGRSLIAENTAPGSEWTTDVEFEVGNGILRVIGENGVLWERE
ncbi:MAG: hypothetical protein SF029_07040 [bacterium]|nr:hypothetical protein [bacterium]